LIAHKARRKIAQELCVMCFDSQPLRSVQVSTPRTGNAKGAKAGVRGDSHSSFTIWTSRGSGNPHGAMRRADIIKRCLRHPALR
jgi:hypothetical protein